MLAINLLSESTDIEHVRDLQHDNTPKDELEFTREMIEILFDAESSTEERVEMLEDHLENIDNPSDMLDGSGPRGTVQDFEQFHQMSNEAFEDLRNIFLYVMGEDISKNKVDLAIGNMRDMGANGLEIVIPRKDEEMAGLM